MPCISTFYRILSPVSPSNSSFGYQRVNLLNPLGNMFFLSNLDQLCILQQELRSRFVADEFSITILIGALGKACEWQRALMLFTIKPRSGVSWFKKSRCVEMMVLRWVFGESQDG